MKTWVGLLVSFVVFMVLIFTTEALTDNPFITGLLMILVYIPINWAAKRITGVDIFEKFFKK